MTRDELIERYWKKIKLTEEREGDWLSQGSGMANNFTCWGARMMEASPLTLHRGVFANTLTLLGSEEQVKKYVPRALNQNIIGCYAQTELGHGSNV